MKPEYKLVAKSKYIRLTAELADGLWREVYARWYPAKQLNAVLDALQSAEAIEEQIDEEANYFIVLLGGKPVGYFAWKMQNTAMHLMHLYLLPEVRGRAIGQDIILYCERLARADGKGRVWCRVHEKALPVQAVMKKLHYRIVQPAPQEVAGYTLPLLEMEHIL